MWIFALYYDREQNTMRYAIDGTIFGLDTVWIENKNFGFQFYKNEKQEYVIRWNASEENLPYTLKRKILVLYLDLRRIHLQSTASQFLKF